MTTRKDPQGRTEERSEFADALQKGVPLYFVAQAEVYRWGADGMFVAFGAFLQSCVT